MLLSEPLREGLGPGAVAAGKDGDGAALLLQFAREFFHDGRLAGAADGQIADGDDLDAEGGIAQNADLDRESGGL